METLPMAFTPEKLLAYLKELGIKTHILYHPVVMNIEEQAKYVGHLEGGHSKNLFIKDKKNRLYLISALTTTNIDLKVLSQRLGLGKGGLRMAPEEAINEVLKVPLGSVTPFALINESARSVVLLLDQNFQDQAQVSFHPLTNDATASLTTTAMDTFLRSIGKEPVYINLEAVVAVGKDHPPDLASFVPTETASLEGQCVEEFMKSASEKKPHTSKETMLSEIESLKLSNGPIRTPAKGKISKESNSLRNATTDPQKLVSYILNQASEAVTAEFTALGLDEKDVAASAGRIKNSLAPELQSIIMMFKNMAYTEGFVAGKASHSLS